MSIIYSRRQLNPSFSNTTLFLVQTIFFHLKSSFQGWKKVQTGLLKKLCRDGNRNPKKIAEEFLYPKFSSAVKSLKGVLNQQKRLKTAEKK